MSPNRLLVILVHHCHPHAHSSVDKANTSGNFGLLASYPQRHATCAKQNRYKARQRLERARYCSLDPDEPVHDVFLSLECQSGLEFFFYLYY